MAAGLKENYRRPLITRNIPANAHAATTIRVVTLVQRLHRLGGVSRHRRANQLLLMFFLLPHFHHHSAQLCNLLLALVVVRRVRV